MSGMWTGGMAGGMIQAMRYILLSLLLSAGLALGGCGTDPKSLGLTGAAMPTPPRDPGEASSGIRGAPETGTQYAPSLAPNTGSGKFWGYN